MRPTNYTKEFHDNLHKRWSQRSLKLYLIAAAPKSGSTWCAEFLADYLGCQTMFAGKVPGRVEQDLDETWLSRMTDGSTAVIHQHCRWHQVSEAYISALQMRPVALLRNASDTVASIRDHLKAQGGNWPFGFVDQDILARSDDDIDTFIVHHIMPWYFNFAVGWISSPFPVLTYAQILTDKERGARRLLEALGIAVDGERISQAITGIEGSRTRFNVGKPGRGRTLNRLAQSHLDRLAEHYSHIDLSPLGIRSFAEMV